MGPPTLTPGGKPLTKAQCMQMCGADGSGVSSPCNSLDHGMPHQKEWGPSFQSQWGTNAVLPGKFGSDGVTPVWGKMSNYKHRWVTVGGEGTSSGNWQETAEKDIIAAKALGCAFDEEGGVSAAGAKP